MSAQTLLSITIILVFAAELQAQELENRFTLLTNGQVIAGKVTQEDGKTFVSKPTGSRIVFTDNRVEAICDSLSDVYLYKCGMVSASDASGHASLFRWCMKNQLFAEARDQIDLLQFLDYSSVQLYKMHQEVTQAIVAQAAKRQRLEYEQKYAITELPASIPADSNVRLAGYTEPAAENGREPVPFPGTRQFDEATQSLHQDSVVLFKRKIEPLLINSCLTSNCHSSDSSVLPLAVISKSISIPKRLSQRNLLNVLKYTDVNRPMESHLMKAAVNPHGGQKQPGIRPHSEQFNLLRQWLISISASPGQIHTLPEDLFEAESSGDTKPNLKVPEKATKLPGAAKIPAPRNAQPPRNSNSKNSSRDPFDPDMFNRRYLKNTEDDN